MVPLVAVGDLCRRGRSMNRNRNLRINTGSNSINVSYVVVVSMHSDVLWFSQTKMIQWGVAIHRLWVRGPFCIAAAVVAQLTIQLEVSFIMMGNREREARHVGTTISLIKWCPLRFGTENVTVQRFKRLWANCGRERRTHTRLNN